MTSDKKEVLFGDGDLALCSAGVADRRVRKLLDLGFSPEVMRLSSDNRLLFAAKKYVQVYNLERRVRIAKIKDTGEDILSLVLLNADKLSLVGNNSGTVHVISNVTARIVKSLCINSQNINDMQVTPNNLIVASGDQTITLVPLSLLDSEIKRHEAFSLPTEVERMTKAAEERRIKDKNKLAFAKSTGQLGNGRGHSPMINDYAPLIDQSEKNVKEDEKAIIAELKKQIKALETLNQIQSKEIHTLKNENTRLKARMSDH